MEIIFVDWLLEELQNRDWSQADLARKSKLSRATISKLINHQSAPAPETCQAIAAAFGVSVELVMQKAGLLSTPEEQSEIIQTVLYNMGFLPVEDQEEILEIIKMKKALRERRDKYK